MMSPLAKAIYDLLRQRSVLDDPRVSYKELAIELRESSDEFERITQRSQRMYVALGEVSEECRRMNLPCLAAMVVRSDSRKPGAAYFHHAESQCRGEQIHEWREELEAVRKATYPSRD